MGELEGLRELGELRELGPLEHNARPHNHNTQNQSTGRMNGQGGGKGKGKGPAQGSNKTKRQASQRAHDQSPTRVPSRARHRGNRAPGTRLRTGQYSLPVMRRWMGSVTDGRQTVRPYALVHVEWHLHVDAVRGIHHLGAAKKQKNRSTPTQAFTPITHGALCIQKVKPSSSLPRSQAGAWRLVVHMHRTCQRELPSTTPLQGGKS